MSRRQPSRQCSSTPPLRSQDRSATDWRKAGAASMPKSSSSAGCPCHDVCLRCPRYVQETPSLALLRSQSYVCYSVHIMEGILSPASTCARGGGERKRGGGCWADAMRGRVKRGVRQEVFRPLRVSDLRRRYVRNAWYHCSAKSRWDRNWVKT